MARNWLGPRDVLALAVWCGLAAGWLEVLTRMLAKSLIGFNRLHAMTQHFVWLVPLSNLLLFLVAGIVLAVGTKWFPRALGWLSARIIVAVALMPALLLAAPQIYAWACMLVALGIAIRLVPWLERPERAWRRWLLWSFPGLLGAVPVVLGVVMGADRLEQWRESARPLPLAGSPNVLLIVLDTVRADRITPYGYPRPTTPALEQLARRAIRFAEARATAPWTLPSHASMFSGRLPHELGVEWRTPLGKDFPTLAEYLGSRGYATAGFVANVEYCSYDAGLNRGFTHYEDYAPDLEHFRPLRTAVLFQFAWDVATFVARLPNDSRFQPLVQLLLSPYRKDAATVNRQFTHWLTGRQQPERPFFAFLNYFDAHVPYLPPEGSPFRFGPGPRTLGDFYVLVDLWKTLDKSQLVPQYKELVQDSYDNCLSYLDGQLGQLFEKLRYRGDLENTLIVVTSDHGEELGEHGLFEHGESLYRPEIHVPLLIVPPGRDPSPHVVTETVSLLDLPATIIDLAGLAGGLPIPGSSLARFWRDASAGTAARATDGSAVISELTGPNPTDPSLGRSPATRGPLFSLAVGDYVYIRNQVDGREQLFHERDDPDEVVNLTKVPAMRPRLLQFRDRLDEIAPRGARVSR